MLSIDLQVVFKGYLAKPLFLFNALYLLFVFVLGISFPVVRERTGSMASVVRDGAIARALMAVVAVVTAVKALGQPRPTSFHF